jgi:ATP-dependent exoDNAse (exonuclease V) beta subunit
MTRARERLLLSGAVDFERWAASRQAPTPISWLATAVAEDLPTLIQQGQSPISDLAVGPQGSVRMRCLLNSPANVGTVLLGPGPAAEPGERLPQQAPQPTPEDAARDAPAERLEQLASRSARAEQGRISALSYTSLSELERCGYRYYLERVIGLVEDRAAARGEGDGLEARARGTLVHSLMESLDFARPVPPSAEDVAAAGRELGMRVGELERVEISQLIETASTASLATRLAAARTVRREHPFAFSLGAQEPLITGVIDLMAGEPDGGYLVVDYKSDRLAPGVRPGDIVERDYAVQRLLYALAVLREGALQVEIVHWFLERPEEWASARFTAADRPALEEQLAERLARARVRPFAVSPRPHRGLCLTCPGRAGLCSWGEAETLREVPELSGAAADQS